MIELIAIKESDSNLYIEGLDGYEFVIYTRNIKDVMTFKNIEDAKSFAKIYLDENTIYDIVKIIINAKEELLDSVNC